MHTYIYIYILLWIIFVFKDTDIECPNVDELCMIYSYVLEKMQLVFDHDKCSIHNNLLYTVIIPESSNFNKLRHVALCAPYTFKVHCTWCHSMIIIGVYHLWFAWNRGHIDLALASWQVWELGQYSVSDMAILLFHHLRLLLLTMFVIHVAFHSDVGVLLLTRRVSFVFNLPSQASAFPVLYNCALPLLAAKLYTPYSIQIVTKAINVKRNRVYGIGTPRTWLNGTESANTENFWHI